MYVKHVCDMDCVVTLITCKKLEIYQFCLRFRGFIAFVIISLISDLFKNVQKCYINIKSKNDVR